MAAFTYTATATATTIVMATYVYIYLHFWDNVTMTVQLALNYVLFGNLILRRMSLRRIPRSYVLGINLNGVQVTEICSKKGEIWVTRYAGSRGCQYQVGQSTMMPIKIVHHPWGAESAMSNDRWTGDVSDESQSLIIVFSEEHATHCQDQKRREKNQS